MEDIFTFNVDSDTFSRVVEGKKTVQLQINDNKHRVYAVGNQISFVYTNEEGETSVQKAEIESLLYFNNFMEAVETIGKEKCGFRPSAAFEKTSDQFLSGESFEMIEKYGLVAIMFKNID